MCPATAPPTRPPTITVPHDFTDDPRDFDSPPKIVEAPSTIPHAAQRAVDRQTQIARETLTWFRSHTTLPPDAPTPEIYIAPPPCFMQRDMFGVTLFRPHFAIVIPAAGVEGVSLARTRSVENHGLDAELFARVLIHEIAHSIHILLAKDIPFRDFLASWTRHLTGHGPPDGYENWFHWPIGIPRLQPIIDVIVDRVREALCPSLYLIGVDVNNNPLFTLRPIPHLIPRPLGRTTP